MPDFPTIRNDSPKTDPSRDELSTRSVVAFGPVGLNEMRGLEDVIVRAADAGRWDVVAQLARELEARRLEGTNVTKIGDRTKRGR